MIYISLILIAFAMYFIYDINSIKWQNRIINSFFAVATGIIAVVTIAVSALSITRGEAAFIHSHKLAAFILLAAVAFALMIYSLFFALPFDETYISNENGRTVCDTGMYALCRHPGILWFCLFYGFAALALLNGTFTACASVMCVLNIIYGIFQDAYSFPLTFDGYEEYKQAVPFIIPTFRSLRNSLDNKLRHQED